MDYDVTLIGKAKVYTILYDNRNAVAVFSGTLI